MKKIPALLRHWSNSTSASWTGNRWTLVRSVRGQWHAAVWNWTNAQSWVVCVFGSYFPFQPKPLCSVPSIICQQIIFRCDWHSAHWAHLWHERFSLRIIAAHWWVNWRDDAEAEARNGPLVAHFIHQPFMSGWAGLGMKNMLCTKWIQHKIRSKNPFAVGFISIKIN